MSDAMNSSDTRCNFAPEARAIEALCLTISLLLLMVSMVPRQLNAVCSGRLESEGRMYYVAKKRVKAHSQGGRHFSSIAARYTPALACYNLTHHFPTCIL